ncbi:MAG TPA: FAD/NAD(P)-binding oxidoreductase [Terriglobales bacterium]|nr:FAD/NAD(P)-binding oxidoreductase [Terriglobales bacterium]
MNESRFVILGGGMVAGYAAKQLVELGLKPGEMTILSADSSVPYERPPLSKGFLAGKDSEESIRINSADFYREHGIEIKVNCEISEVDPGRKRLVLKAGGEFGYGKLIVATGASPRTLAIPGADLKNLYYLRSLDSSKAIRSAAEKSKRAVVIGGGFIGMEVAAVLAQKNIEVTMILTDDRLGKRLFSPQMSTFFESYYATHGVKLIKSATATELRGDGVVSAVVVNTGQSVPCDLVVAGIGVHLNTAMFANSGIEIADGVMVNEYLETSHPDIYAAGDIANYPDVLFEKRRRVEHWDNAVSQGQFCARSLMGERVPFKHVPYFFSDIFDLSYEYWGDLSGADEAVHRGDLSSKNFSVWWLRQKHLVAAFVMGRPDEERESAPKWIESKQSLSAAKLADQATPISSSLE